MKSPEKILVAGGAGYIGSHVCVCLAQAGFDVHVVDNFSNSSPESLARVQQISNREIPYTHCDLRDVDAVDRLFSENQFAAVIHLAGLKAVGESVEKPSLYFNTNLYSTMVLTEAMTKHDCKVMLFSSSATVYGDPDSVPIKEDAPLRVTNPYGRTKLMIEEMLGDIQAGDPNWKVMSLRYFNPVGAHESGRLGEDPSGIPNNLFPYIAQVAVGRRERLGVFGDDYPTPDGTGVRDYIHVVDLAKGHVKALQYLLDAEDSRCIPSAVNLGTGKGISVLDALGAFSKAAGRDLPHEVLPRRAGDVAACYADATLAKSLLKWEAEKTLEDMCADHWRWQSENPAGYL